MKDKLTAFLLAVLMVAQVIAPQAAWASGNNFNLEKKQDLVKIGELDTKSYPKLDNKTILSIQKQAREKQKTQKRKPGAGFFSKDNPYLPGQNPTDEEKAAAYGRIRVLFETEGLNDNGALKDFQWREIFGEDSNGNLTNAKIHFIQRDAKTNEELGRYTLNVNQAGEYKWTDTFGKVALLPLYSNALEPYKYDASLEYQISDKVKLLAMEIGTTNEKISFTEEGDKNVADIPLKLKLGQVASTKFESEWKTSLDENSRPQVEGLFNTKNKDQDNYDIENLIAFPKNNTDSIKLRNDNVDPNNPPDLPYDQSPGLSFRNVPEVKVVEGLEFADENDLVGTPTYHLDEANKTITTLDGAHKFKYDFNYDVINGGKLTMTEIIPVTFDANGGKFDAITDPAAKQEIKKEVDYDGNLTDKVEEPKKDLETFKGWATAKNGTPLSKEEFEKATKNIKEAKTFYAIWDNNVIEAEELEVKESFKDGETWVNNFIPTFETLKGQVKIKDGSGKPQDLATGDTFAIVDGANEYTTDAAAKDYLYNLLKEDEGTEVSRDVTLKAKVTHVNGTSQTVDIPIKVFKNIYEAKTLTEKPIYVPDGYVKVTLDPTTKAKDPQKTYYYVNPNAKVFIPGEDPVGTGDNQFAKWLIKGTETEYKLVDKPRHQFEAETTIEAQYVSDVIPQDGDTKPEGVPDNFVKVTFVPTDKGTMEGTKIFWVNPKKEVTIPVKNPVGKQYFTFNEWKIGDVKTGETYTVGTAKKFGTATTITATYDEAKNIISYDPSVPDPMVRPEGYVRVTFAAEPGLKLTDQKAYYVKKNAKITLKAIKNDTNNYGYPGVTANTGYKFKEWDKADTFEIEEADIVVTAKATKLGNVIPEKDDKGNPNTKPEGYMEVTFVVKTGDESKGSITGVNKFYVNPTEYVTIDPPTTKANTGYEFGSWSHDATNPTNYKTDTTITASFNGLKDVIPKTNPDGTENKQPAGYKTVTFYTVLPERGKIADGETTVYYVKPNTPVTIPAPKTEANTGYKFDQWYLMGVQKYPSEAVSYDKDTKVEGRFVDLPSFIPSTDEHDNPNAKPSGYVTVIFTDGKYGTITSGKKVYYVNPDANVKMSDLTSSKNKNRPQVTPDTGYKFSGWRYDADHPINKDLIVPANYTYEKDVIPKTKDDDSEKPKGYITVTFVKGDHGTLTGQAVYYVNPNKAVALDDKAPKVTPNTGYDFAGWDTQIEKKIQYSNGDVITALYNEKGDVIPQEDPDGTDKPAGYLTVTFAQGDHGELSGKTVYYVKPNKEVTVPAPTVKPETGWKQKDGNEAWDAPLTQTFTADNTTITAQYAPIADIIPGDQTKPEGYVTIKFVGKNGTLSGTTTYYVNPNKEVDLKDQANGLSKKADVGYTADGGTWDKLKGKFTEGEKITFTFIALPDVIEGKPGSPKPDGYVTVKFLAGLNGSLDGGDKIYYVNPNAKVKIGGTDIPVPATTPKTDYEFKEWIDAVDKTNPIIDNQTHVAQFVYNPATVTLTYEAPDATSGDVPDAQTVKKGDKVILADANTLKKDNATLSGWKIGDTEYPVGASVTLNDNTTAKAVWTTNSHTVEFNTDGGTYIPSQKVAHGNKIKPVDPPTKPGHTFTGWTLNGNAFDPAKDTITGDSILVANYVPNVVEQPDPNDPTTKPAVPENFVKVTVDPTDKATDPTTQVFWVKPNETVQIPAKHPTGKQVGDTTYVFDSWNPSLIGKFSGPTTIEAQYKKQTPLTPIFDPRITTGVVATDLNKQPPLDAYKDQIKSETNKEFDLVEIVEQPKVDESGFTSAKIKIRFTENGMIQVVDVLVYVKPDPVIIEKPYPVPGDCNNSCDQPSKPNQPNQPNIGMDALNTTDHYQYLIGYPDGNFAPNRGMTRAEVATMFTRLLKERPVKGQRYYTGFSDIQDGDWYANTVGYAVQVGIVSGYPDGSFKPNKPITRAEFASIASRFDALAQGNNIAFNDLAPSHWGYNAIRSAATKGWISGYPDNTFRPEKAISRAEVTSITNRMLNRYADLYWIDAHRGEVIRFGDVKRGDWYFEPIMEATMGHDFIRDRDGKTEHWTGLNGKSFI